MFSEFRSRADCARSADRILSSPQRFFASMLPDFGDGVGGGVLAFANSSRRFSHASHFLVSGPGSAFTIRRIAPR